MSKLLLKYGCFIYLLYLCKLDTSSCPKPNVNKNIPHYHTIYNLTHK